MKPSILLKLDQLTSRLAEIDRSLSDPRVTENLDQYRKLTREHAELAPLIEQYDRYRAAASDELAAREFLGDPDMKTFAEDELREARARMEDLALAMEKLLLPKDPNDERNLFLEIRAGTGGDESGLFVGNLLRMYSRYAERRRWQVEIVSESPSELGGYKEIILRVCGQGAYSRLKFESGGHRVQRVPETARGTVGTPDFYHRRRSCVPRARLCTTALDPGHPGDLDRRV